MKFIIEYTGKAENRKLVYNATERSFDTKPLVQEVNFDVVVNGLNLSVVDEDRKIIQVWGFCGVNKKMESKYEVPQCGKGLLKVVDDLESGLAYKISKQDLPVCIDSQNGWICVGNPEKEDTAVEFMNNCIAVINDDNELVSLWLKPELSTKL